MHTIIKCIRHELLTMFKTRALTVAWRRIDPSEASSSSLLKGTCSSKQLSIAVTCHVHRHSMVTSIGKHHILSMQSLTVQGDRCMCLMEYVLLCNYPESTVCK